MSSDSRNLPEVLQQELQFLEEGGYRNSPSAQRRPQFVFQDSPTCLNFDKTKTLHPCHQCVMAGLILSDCLGERFPCQHIPLNDAGFTIDTYTRLGTFEPTETTVHDWLRKKIHELETPSSASKESKI